MSDSPVPQNGSISNKQAMDSVLTEGPSTPPSMPNAHDAHEDLVTNYRLLHRLGAGGMGEVWLAEQFHPVKRHVAIKLIRSDGGSREVIARFEAERQTMAMLDHPHIARILDAGTTNDGRPYFAMEVVHGSPLTELCDQKRLTVTQRLELFLATCSGVQHAHQKGVIHRDLKPSNILVTSIDERPVPKVIDFGLAKALRGVNRLADQTAQTHVGQILGTLRYMSPEQATLDNVDIDTRADVYALGVILYELLTGSTPLEERTIRNASLMAVLETIREEEPVRPSQRLAAAGYAEHSMITERRRTDRSSLSRILIGDLDWIVMKALEKNPNRRYATVLGLMEDVEHFLRDEPVIARPPSLRYRLQKFMRKNRTSVIAASVILGTLVLGLGGTSWGLVIARQKQSELQVSRTKERQQYRLTRVQDANRLRERGQYLEAAQIMQSLRLADQFDADVSMAELTASERLTLARDLYQAQEIAAAQREVDAIPVDSFTNEERAEFDLLQGELWLMSARDREGFERVQASIKSGLLELADQAYAKSLVADTIAESNQYLSECLERNPLHVNALVRRIWNETVAGQFGRAESDVQLGKQLFPRDLRFSFLEALRGALGSSAAKSAAIAQFRQASGRDAELKVLQLIAEIHAALEADLNSTDSGGSPLSSASLFKISVAYLELATTVSSKYEENNRFGFPKSSWTGRLTGKIVDALTPTISGAITGKLIDLPKLQKIQSELPDHQLINFLVALVLMAEGQNTEAYQAFLVAARADSFIDDVRPRAAWFALICAAIRHRQNQTVDVSEVREMERIVYAASSNFSHQKALSVPVDTAYYAALNLKLFELGNKLCREQLSVSSGETQALWQRRIDQLTELQKQVESLTRQTLDAK